MNETTAGKPTLAQTTPSFSGKWMVLIAAFLGWMFDGLEMGLFPIIARPAIQDLLHVTDDKLVGLWNGIIQSCFLVGAACGGLLFGWMGDKLGRVKTMVWSILAYSLFTGLGYVATHPWQLGVLRFMAAMGMGGEWSLGVALVMECWPERHRPVLAGMIGAASNVGFLLIAVVGMLFPVTITGHGLGWRWMMLAGAAPALLCLFILGFVPESQRWKASVQKGPSRPLAEIFSPALAKKTILAICFAGIPLIGTWAAVSGWVPVWTDQLAEKQEIAKISRQINAPTPLTRDQLTPEQVTAVKKETSGAKAVSQIMISIGAIIGCFLAPVIGGKIGRRPAYFGLCLLSLIVCGILFRAMGTYSPMFLLVVAAAGLTTAAFYGWLPLYLPELFPTRVRATGQGLSFNFGRVIAAAGVMGMGLMVYFRGGDYTFALGTITLIYVLGLFLIWLAPETKGKPLPE